MWALLKNRRYARENRVRHLSYPPVEFILVVIPANACMDAGGRTTLDAKAEAEIQLKKLKPFMRASHQELLQ